MRFRVQGLGFRVVVRFRSVCGGARVSPATSQVAFNRGHVVFNSGYLSSNKGWLRECWQV